MAANDPSAQEGAPSSFGSYLRAQRQLADLTLRQVAELARVSNPYLSQIERGLHQPSVNVIKSLAKALNLSADALLAHAAGISDEEQPPHDSTEAAIRRDPDLSDQQKGALLSVYRSMLPAGTTGPSETSTPTPGARRTGTAARASTAKKAGAKAAKRAAPSARAKKAGGTKATTSRRSPSASTTRKAKS